MHRATVMAVELAADPNLKTDLAAYQVEKLYFQTMPKDVLRWAVWAAPLLGIDPHKFGHNHDIDLATIVKDGTFPTHARINCRSVLEVRNEATACHESQLGGAIGRKGPMAFLRRYFGLTETYMRKYPAPEKGLHETDLFEGIG
jgi:hypothetical protein